MISDILEYEYGCGSKEVGNYNAKKMLLHFVINDFFLECNKDVILLAEKVVIEIEKYEGLVIPILEISNCEIENDLVGILNLTIGVRDRAINKDIILLGLNSSVTFLLLEQFINSENKASKKGLILVYSKFNQYFLPIILWGNNMDELCLFNFTYLNVVVKTTNTLELTTNKPLKREEIVSTLFYGENYCLKEFDAVISYQGENLFELFVSKCLDTSISYKSEEIVDFEDKNFSGYKIGDGHFKIGSRIHISDFYYAKRMFQTSDYVNKFSILIVRKLLTGDSKEKLIAKIIEGGVTILGYAKYSKLLILRIEQYLKKKVREFIQEGVLPLKINTSIIKDREEPSLLENENNIFPNLLLIIPISSTLSTSIKITEYFAASNTYQGKKIIEPVINMIIVADKQAQQDVSSNCHKIIKESDDLYLYHWRNIDYEKKIITLQITLERPLLNTYILLAFTKWYKVNECHICFGDDGYNIRELPLIDTDKASITPHLIMGEAPAFSKDDTNPEVLLQGSYHNYGHFKINGVHSIHFIDPRLFLTIHKRDIITWLAQRKEKAWFKNIRGNICIVTPDGEYNSDFVYLVNEILFNYAATIVRYNAATAFTSNFKVLYGSLIENAESVIYVDDQVSKGMSFERIRHFIRICCDNKPFTAFITMICSSDLDTIKIIEKSNSSAIGNHTVTVLDLEYFKYLRIHSLVSNKIPCPICKAKDDYIDFAEASSLDSTKYYLYKKAQRLNGGEELVKADLVFGGYENSIDEDFFPLEDRLFVDKYSSFFENPFKNNNLLKLLVEDYINRVDKLNEKIGQDDFLDNFIDTISIDLSNKYKAVFSADEVAASLIKVLSFAPYAQYYPIRMAIFAYLNKRLDNEYAKLEGDYKIEIQFLRLTKLLLRRISVLKGNYIIKKQNFVKLLNFYRHYEVTRDEDNQKIENSVNRHLFFVISFLDSLDIDISNDKKWANQLADIEIIFRLESQLYFYSENKHVNISTILIDIVCKFKNKIKTAIEQLSDNPRKIDVTSDVNKKRLLYCCRSLQNLYYKRELRSDYHYFMAHIVKEITYNSDARALHIDRIIDSEYKEIDKPPSGLTQLLRIVKMENTGILRRFLNSKFISQLCDLNIDLNNQDDVISEIKKILEAPSNYYDLEPLLFFLNNERETSWQKNGSGIEKIIVNAGRGFELSISFFDFMRLYLFLISQADNLDKDPHEKIKFIIKNIQKILNVDEPDVSKAFLAIRHTPYNQREITLDDLIIFNEDADMIGKDRLLKPFALEVFNGLMLREKGTFQNLFVFQIEKTEKRWSSLKAYYTNRLGKSYKGNYLNDYSEADFFSEFNDMLFFRISNLYYKKEGEEILDVVNNGQAVLAIASKRERPYMPEKLRYLLLLKEHLSKFFYKHYTNDSFKSFLIEKEVHDYYTTLRHGFGSYVSYVRDLYGKLISEYDYPFEDKVADISSVSDSRKHRISILKAEYNLFFRLALDEVNISAMIAEGVSKKMTSGSDDQSYLISDVCFGELKELIENLSTIISLSKGFDHHYGSESYFANKYENFKTKSTFKGNRDLLYLIISELFINIRKRNWNGVDDSINVKWIVIDIGTQYILRQENTFLKGEKEHSSGGRKGLVMINNILRYFFGTELKHKKTEGNIFSIEILLNKQ